VSALRAAKGYVRRGIAVVPVPHRKKGPISDGWQDLRLTVEDLPQHFDGRPQNVGLILGEPSGGLVDVDLDAEEAAKVAGRFLPPTLTSGRESSPHSHWWYFSPGIETMKFKDVDGRMLVELRSTGCQTIVDPSVHPSGELVVWHDTDPEPAEDEAGELVRCVRELATATLIARHLPPIGGRHDFALALAGVLLRPNRFDEAPTLKILKAAWDAKGYPDGKSKREAHRDLEAIVRDTAEKLAVGEPVVGGPKLEESTPGVAKRLSRWWSWERDSHVPPTTPEPLPWPELSAEALYELPGDIVRAIEPHSEADPAALLANVLCAFGNLVGRGAFARVGADEHHTKLFVGLVGETAKGRKGLSWSPVWELMHAVDPGWAENRVVSGLSSGEGLIYAVRDEVRGIKKDEEVVLDPGEPDKRLLVVEGELSNVLKVMGREGNTLSPTMRQAWDGDRLSTLTKNNPTKATGAHVSIIGHITKAELLRHLNETEAANGFANRFLWLMVRRSKELPFGGEWDSVDISSLVRRLDSAVRFAREPRVIRWGESATEVWREVYGPLSEGKPGLFGAVTGRAEAQTLRLATLHAVMDKSETIEYEHLAAALALWEYAEESAQYIFGDATGDLVADNILEALRAAGSDGLTRTEIRDLFGRHKSAERINQALGELLRLGRVRKTSEQTGGRPTERWFAK
jgi:Protein of unknown function (DUF3987)/Bifunctional DNA primase/polymerase, N-terminal